MDSYAVRITHSQTAVKHILAVWATQCEKVVAFEHTDTAKIHSHLLIINCRVGKKQLRNLASTCGVNVKGNENMSFKAYDFNKRYLVYMSKGQFSPYYLKGFTQEECEEARLQWNPNERKENPTVQLYNKFESALSLKSEEFKDYVANALKLNSKIDDIRFDWVKSKAYMFAFEENQRIANHVFSTKYKMLVNTYCMRHHISMGNWKGSYM